MQSFMVSQSHRNSIWLCGLRSELASFGLILSRFRLGGLHSDFCLIAILGQLMAFGCNLSELCQDCLNPAIDPQFTGLHQDCKEPENSVYGIARHLERLESQSRRNRSGHKSGPIGAQSIWIATGLLKIKNPVTIVRIVNIEVSIAGGLRQPERARFGDCGAPRGLQRIPEQPSGPALESGLKPDGQPLG